MLRLGDRELARIGLGTNRLRHTAENVTLLRGAVAAGVTMIDTAHLYTGGESEVTIGEALSAARDRCMVATKGGWGAGQGRPEIVRTEIEESLRRLRTQSIDLWYLHRVDPETPLEESLALVGEFQDNGRIEHIGLSEVGIEQIEQGRQIVPIASVQNHYNLSERKHEDVVDYCAGEGILFVPFFPLRGDISPALVEIAALHEATAVQIKLAWLLKRSPTMLPIPGSLSPAHVSENLAALEIALSDGEFEALR
jgi:pyridoxine 4-dehydrogenase